MNRSVGSRPVLLRAALAALLVAIPPALVDAKAKHVRTQEREQRHSPPPKLQQTSVAKPQETIDAWTVSGIGARLGLY